MRARHRDDPTMGNLAAGNSLENEPSGIAKARGFEGKKTVEVGLTTFVRFQLPSRTYSIVEISPEIFPPSLAMLWKSRTIYWPFGIGIDGSTAFR
jgi:hypothetical protein